MMPIYSLLLEHLQKIINSSMNMIGVGLSSVPCNVFSAAKIPNESLVCGVTAGKPSSVNIWVIYLVGEPQRPVPVRKVETAGFQQRFGNIVKMQVSYN